MNAHINKSEAAVSRRQVMIGAAGLSFAIALGGRGDAAVITGRAHGPGSEPMGQHRAGWHHHHHVGGDRDGAGIDDLAAADHRRGARRRLEQGEDCAGSRRSRRSTAIRDSAA